MDYGEIKQRLLQDGFVIRPLQIKTLGGPTLYGGDGAPATALGADGDYYFRRDTPGTANQRLYVKASGSWSGVV